MVGRPYIPDAGDLVWLNFSPRAGHEQAGRRPAIVLTPRSYNQKAGLAVMCPLTREAKGYPFEVPIPKPGRMEGVILTDHIKSVDWQSRQAQKIGRVPAETLQQVRATIAALIGI